MFEVDKEKIQKMLKSDLTSDEIAEYSGIAYTTARELKDGITVFMKHHLEHKLN